jgi:hypothetical protein
MWAGGETNAQGKPNCKKATADLIRKRERTAGRKT